MEQPAFPWMLRDDAPAQPEAEVPRDVLYDGARVAAILDIRQMLGASSEVQDRIFKRAAEKKTVVKVDLTEGDQILVTAGPFKDFQGEVIEVSGERNKLKALLSIFGRETPVELEFSQISKQN